MIGRCRWARCRLPPRSRIQSGIPGFRAQRACGQGQYPAQAVPPGPDNPLGKYALRLASASYLIHGTNKPFAISMQITHGCMRLYPEDMKALFTDVPVGTPV